MTAVTRGVSTRETEYTISKVTKATLQHLLNAMHEDGVPEHAPVSFAWGGNGEATAKARWTEPVPGQPVQAVAKS